MDNVSTAFAQAPPIARTFALAAFIATVTGLAKYCFFHPYLLWRFPPQVWRLATSFLITGPNLGILFDTYFLYHYLSSLESGDPRFRRKEDLAWYLMFVGGTMITIDSLLGLNQKLYLEGLIIAMCYTATQDLRGMKSKFYFFTIPAQLTPYCMILINLFMPGGVLRMIVQVEGLLAGHLYTFLTRIWPVFGSNSGKSLIPTPKFLTTLINIRTGYTPSETSSGPLPGSWETRGQGRRLG